MPGRSCPARSACPNTIGLSELLCLGSGAAPRVRSLAVRCAPQITLSRAPKLLKLALWLAVGAAAAISLLRCNLKPPPSPGTHGEA